ncbi:glycosyltransferase family 2 protein [Bifidobacterium vansinderenii]|uniref:Glycosyltransferase family 2 n=1 Tax=Bifidobacterium vansinderenii TaxID=1984871 RepID=A0A229W022_9BIFI|nr:glycosyltransferase family 2 protein [Bifidobacterium vansinderenii]OXN01192.1 glycosyltransferase family 2 [Bifidobacterium vansinderenii]
MNPLISIVVPVYKVEEVLDRCVKSILEQTYEYWEVILVDDESPDGSPALCDQWAQRDSRIRVVHQSHAGVSTARNRGIAEAKGDFLVFVDSDDFVDNDYLECLLKAQEHTGADLVMCSAVCEDDEGRPKRTDEEWTFDDMPEDRLFTGRETLRFLYRTIGAVLWGKLYAKRIWNTLRFPDGKIHEDEFVLHHVYFACESVAVLHRKPYHYIDARPSIMHADYSLKRLDRLDAKIDRLAFFTKHDVDRDLIEREFIDLNKHIIWSRALPWNAPENKPRFRELFASYRAIPFSILSKLPLKSGINYIGTRLCPFTYWSLHERGK